MFPTEDDRAELHLAALPPAVSALLEREGASPRLVAHLTLVHDVSFRLLRRLRKSWPQLVVDVDAVAFGAATHDIGKARHPVELLEPGKLHEADGERLLLEQGTSPALARFARTHGAWEEAVTLSLEDLLVVVADTAWKARRAKALDDARRDGDPASGICERNPLSIRAGAGTHDPRSPRPRRPADRPAR